MKYFESIDKLECNAFICRSAIHKGITLHTKQKLLVVITMKLILILIIFILIPIILQAQDIRINEVMSSNATTIADEDADYPDWIEIYNAGDKTVNLAGYGLSDDEKEPFKWIFPAIQLIAHNHLLIFASDKDRRQIVNHWDTIINWGDEWKYRLGRSEPPSNWMSTEFNDSGWLAGPSGFGYGDNDDATIVQETISLYIRKTFILEDLDNIVKAVLHVDYDDAFVAYLNGVEIARENIGQPGIPPPFNQGAATWREAEIYQAGFPEKFDVDSAKMLLQEGKNVLAIQVHNYDINSSDLTLIPFFTLGLNRLPDDPIGIPDILPMPSLRLHTNFKIKSSGETLLLTDLSRVIIDSLQTGNIPPDISRGRHPDGNSTWLFFNAPTPGSSNNTQGYLDMVKSPEFSHPGGFYSGILALTLKSDSPTAVIYYSLDGSEPDVSSKIYSGPIILDKTTVVRAKASKPEHLPSCTITHTYLFDARTTLPIISLSTAAANLFDPEYGIYVLGNNYQSANPNFGANFWQDWERPIHVEFYEPDGTVGFNIDVGVKIFGGWSRARPQKPLAIFARGKYGYNEINYQLFPDRPIHTFKAFLLRNSANDWDRTMFSDGMMQSLVESLDIDTQAFRPCVVYINGEYWGILNIREKMNEDYLASHHAVDPNNIDLLENRNSPIEGDSEHYDRMIDFISNHDMSLPENYEYIKLQMNVENFIDYNVAQIYFDNRDWPGNNIKFWRPKTEDGKWRWLLYDTDWGFGINAYGRGGNAYPYDYNTLEYATSPQPTPAHHANPSWATLLLRKLLENNEFKNDFINHFADRLNTIFQSDIVINKMNEIQAMIAGEMPYHFEKWRHSYPLWSKDRLWWSHWTDWYANVQVMRDFAKNRIPHVRSHILKKFKLDRTVLITLDVSPPGAGKIKISTIVIEEFPWQGVYFSNVPIQIMAIPVSSYKFSRWLSLNQADSDTIRVELTHNISFTAVFEPDGENKQAIVINEINYNSASNFNAQDWVELYNNSTASIDLSEWEFKDSDDSHVFTIPHGTILKPQAYLVLCEDTVAFKACFPAVKNRIGNWGFGLSGNGELIRLYDTNDLIVDSLTYGNKTPWQTEPDGNGPTIELKNPNLDNSLAENWVASENHGTPGAKNGFYSDVDNLSSTLRPTEFALCPNYPNPFNSVTTLSYQLPELSHVNLSIYNVFGQLVETLVNEIVAAGYHTIEWNAAEFSSGVYVYKILTGGYSAKGKCLLLK